MIFPFMQGIYPFADRMLPASLLAVILAGCGPVPADTQGTEARLRAGDTLVVGIVAAPGDRAEALALAARTARRLGFGHEVRHGTAEDQLPALAEGEIDLVIGRFARNTPWTSQVLMSRAIGREPASASEPALRYATRNGENRWAMTIDRLTGETAPGA